MGKSEQEKVPTQPQCNVSWGHHGCVLEPHTTGDHMCCCDMVVGPDGRDKDNRIHALFTWGGTPHQ